MNNVANISNILTPSIAAQSLRQHHSSMYQQHTYMDLNHVAVTDVIFQEQYSHSSWVPPQPNPLFLTNNGSYLGNAQMPPGYGYVTMPGAHFFTANASAAYSQAYAALSTITTSGVYMPQYLAPQTQYVSLTSLPPPPPPPLPVPVPVKRYRDAYTQVNFIKSLRSLVKLKKKSSSNPLVEGNQTAVSGSQTNSSASQHSGAGDGAKAQVALPVQIRNSEVVLPQQRLHEIIRLALYGSEIAEKLASLNRTRPCFKRIDTLCARLQQDLMRPSAVMANINSQGMAWAVKDFIFVFTRIINAWVILKGYVYNTPKGLNKIKDELPSDFMLKFDNWQTSTLCFLDIIIKSFVCLDEKVQQQKNCIVKLDTVVGNINNDFSSDSSSHGISVPMLDGVPVPTGHRYGPGGHSTPNNNSCLSAVAATATLSMSSVDMLNISSSTGTETTKLDISLNYLYNMIEDSEETQCHVGANDTYFKTGTYTPLKREPQPMHLLTCVEPVAMIDPPNLLPENPVESNAWQFPFMKPAPVLEHEQLKSRPWQRPSNVRSYINPYSIVGREVARKIADFCGWILNLHSVEQFFQKDIIQAYFPEFYMRCQRDFYDVRSIILKCESGIYDHVYEAIHDLRHISFVVHSYLKVYDDYRLRLHIDRFDRVVDEMLAKPPSLPNQYDHIRGRPGEKLFNYEI